MNKSIYFGLISALYFCVYSQASNPESLSLGALYEQFDRELSYKPIAVVVPVKSDETNIDQIVDVTTLETESQKMIQAQVSVPVQPDAQLHKMDQDVHKFNVQGIKKGDFVRAIIPFDTETAEDLTVDVIWIACAKEEGMSAPAIAPKKATVENSFKILQQHIKNSAIEVSETQLPVEKILSRVWYLILFEQNEAERISKLEELCQVMCDHLGCYQGYAGRIAHLYITWMRSHLGF